MTKKEKVLFKNLLNKVTTAMNAAKIMKESIIISIDRCSYWDGEFTAFREIRDELLKFKKGE